VFSAGNGQNAQLVPHTFSAADASTFLSHAKAEGAKVCGHGLPWGIFYAKARRREESNAEEWRHVLPLLAIQAAGFKVAREITLFTSLIPLMFFIACQSLCQSLVAHSI
jgi:hypothetical protein